MGLTMGTTCHACSGHEAGPQAHQVMSLSKLSSEEMYIWQHMRLVSSSLSGRDLKAQDSAHARVSQRVKVARQRGAQGHVETVPSGESLAQSLEPPEHLNINKKN